MKGVKIMSEKEKQLAENILGIFDQLPDAKKHQLLGVAQGMDISSVPVALKEKPGNLKNRKRRKPAEEV